MKHCEQSEVFKKITNVTRIVFLFIFLSLLYISNILDFCLVFDFKKIHFIIKISEHKINFGIFSKNIINF